MDIKVISSIVGFALATSAGGIAQAATETTETTIERSTSVEAPKAAPRVKEETTTTTKRGLFGRTKSETKTTRTERDPDNVNSSEVKSRTTTRQTERSY